jgi:hypothetical protein
MSDQPMGHGWWMASDGKWYPPESFPGAQPPPPPPSGRVPAWLVPSHVSGWAVASGYLGLITFILCGVPGPFALLAGLKALDQIKRRPDLNGKVRAWVGITFGALGTAFIIVVAIAYALSR